MYASPDSNLILYIEIDEHQHLNNNTTYNCEEKRMSDIYDETPGKHVLFIRFNPHEYKYPKKYDKLLLKQKLNILLETIKYITSEDYIKNIENSAHLKIIYICYSYDNKLLSKSLPHTLVYSEEDIK